VQLRCDRHQIAAGDTAICEIQHTSDDIADTVEFAVTSSSERVRIPATVRGRSGLSTSRFEVTTDPEGPQETVTIEAHSAAGTARESMLVTASGSLHLRVPQHLTATPGSPARFTANALDDQGLPVSMAVVTKPNDAAFDPNTGQFEWTPADRDLGTNRISLTAVNSLGLTTTKTVDIQVVAAQPTLSSLRNGSGVSALAACSPGAFASLIGTSLASAVSAGAARVFVNGTETSVLRASEDQVDFLCPALSPGTPLAISANVAGQASNELSAVMQKTAPGLLSVDGSGSGEGIVVHSGGFAGLPRFGRAATPLIAGDAITLFATGINCTEISGAPKPLIYFGHDYQQITWLQPSAFPGVCEVHSVVPAGVSGNRVDLALESIREDGTAIRSNTIQIVIE
jgi:uncharacterized protein (TIGR03437 family)